jgi:hypothetical protein
MTIDQKQTHCHTSSDLSKHRILRATGREQDLVWKSRAQPRRIFQGDGISALAILIFSAKRARQKNCIARAFLVSHDVSERISMASDINRTTKEHKKYTYSS